jgi:hypothetical protein
MMHYAADMQVAQYNHEEINAKYSTSRPSARTNSNVPIVGASVSFSGSLAVRTQQAKMDADLRTSSSHGTRSIRCVHDYYPFALEDGGRLAPMAVDLVDRLAILVAV